MKNKLTKKQNAELIAISFAMHELSNQMFNKIKTKTIDGTKGWRKMNAGYLCSMAKSKAEDAACGDYEQILDAANYLLFAWIKAGRP